MCIFVYINVGLKKIKQYKNKIKKILNSTFEYLIIIFLFTTPHVHPTAEVDSGTELICLID